TGSIADAAVLITSTIASGWEIIDTCDAATSVIVACACSAIWRCDPGVMIRSSVPMTAHAGMSFQAGGPDGSATAISDAGRWVAVIRAACSDVRSLAKLFSTTLGRRYVSTTPSGAPGKGAS